MTKKQEIIYLIIANWFNQSDYVAKNIKIQDYDSVGFVTQLSKFISDNFKLKTDD